MGDGISQTHTQNPKKRKKPDVLNMMDIRRKLKYKKTKKIQKLE